MHASWKWRENDVASLAIYTGERDEAERVLRALGFTPESLAEVEAPAQIA